MHSHCISILLPVCYLSLILHYIAAHWPYFYLFMVLDVTNCLFMWCNSLFAVLYPTGITGELGCTYLAITFLYNNQHVSSCYTIVSWYRSVQDLLMYSRCNSVCTIVCVCASIFDCTYVCSSVYTSDVGAILLNTAVQLCSILGSSSIQALTTILHLYNTLNVYPRYRTFHCTACVCLTVDVQL